MTLRIKSWKKFQHFKDRKPPWIKLYRDLLDDPDWHELDGEAAKVLTMLWLIASESDGELPDDKKLAFRLRMKEAALNQILKRLSHWLDQDDITPISDGYHDDAPETEAEAQVKTEAETDRAPSAPTNGTRLIEGWKPSDEARTFAEVLLGEDRALAEFDKFFDHFRSAPGQRGVKKDWDATWRNWCRRSTELASNGVRKNENTSSVHAAIGKLAGRLAELDRPAPSFGGAGELRGGAGESPIRLVSKG